MQSKALSLHKSLEVGVPSAQIKRFMSTELISIFKLIVQKSLRVSESVTVKLVEQIPRVRKSTSLTIGAKKVSSSTPKRGKDLRLNKSAAQRDCGVK